MAAGSTSDAPTPATSAPVQQQPERTAPLDSLKQEIGTEFLKLHEALRGMTKTQDDMARQLADTSKSLNSVPQLIQDKCREVADHLTSTHESSLTEIADQLTEQLSLANMYRALMQHRHPPRRPSPISQLGPRQTLSSRLAGHLLCFSHRLPPPATRRPSMTANSLCELARMQLPASWSMGWMLCSATVTTSVRRTGSPLLSFI